MPQVTGQLQLVGHDRRQILVGLEFKDLGSDVGVQPGELGPGLSHQAAEHGFHLVGIEAELAVQVAGADVFVCVAFDAGGEAQHQASRFGSSGHQFGEAIEIVLVVHNDRHLVGVGEQQLLVGFVVAVQHHAIPGHPPAQRRQQFTG